MRLNPQNFGQKVSLNWISENSWNFKIAVFRVDCQKFKQVSNYVVRNTSNVSADCAQREICFSIRIKLQFTCKFSVFPIDLRINIFSISFFFLKIWKIAWCPPPCLPKGQRPLSGESWSRPYSHIFSCAPTPRPKHVAGCSKKLLTAVADLGFLRGGGADPRGAGGATYDFAKLKEFGPRGGLCWITLMTIFLLNIFCEDISPFCGGQW